MSQIGKLDYSIDSAKLTSSTGEVIEFKDLISSVDFYESLLSPYIKCELFIVDSSNLLEVAPIIGQEKIELTITEANNKVKRTFYVGSVSNYVRGLNRGSGYTLNLITEEQMMNSLMLVSHAYSGSIDQSITNIVSDYLNSKIKITEKSLGDYRVIIPNWNPFQAIDWLSRRAINNTQTPFSFYETVIDGFKFESFETMFNKAVYNKFVHKAGTNAESDAENQQASYNVAIEYDLKEYSNTYKNTLKGTFGSGLHIIDNATKTYKLLKYKYSDDFKKKKHLDSTQFINPDFKVNGKGIDEYDAFHSIAIKNTKAFGTTKINNYNNEVEFTKLEADPFLHQLSLNKINIIVRGRLDLSPGNVIEFEVDRDKPLVYGNNKDTNEYISGKYLVLNTHHKMTNGKYTLILDIVRDSFGKKVKKTS